MGSCEQGNSRRGEGGLEKLFERENLSAIEIGEESEELILRFRLISQGAIGGGWLEASIDNGSTEN